MTNFYIFLSTAVQEDQMYTSPLLLLSRNPWEAIVILTCFLIYIIIFVVVSLYYSFYGYPMLSSNYKLCMNNGTVIGCTATEVNKIIGENVDALLPIDFVEDNNNHNDNSRIKIITE